MRRRRHLLGIAVLVLMIAGAAQLFSAKMERAGAETRDQAPRPENATPPRETAVPGGSLRLVPLYAAGDLLVASNEPKAKVPEKTRSAEPKKIQDRPERPTVQDQPVSIVASAAEWPSLEVAYDRIGFERYLEVVERVGRFFTLIRRDGNMGLGPHVSLRWGYVDGALKADLRGLAERRPHLVRDPKIRDRLASLRLPPDADRESLVLVFTEPFDSLLWNTIGDAVDRHGTTLEDVGHVTGSYFEAPNGVFLDLESAFMREGGAEFRLDRRMRVSL